VIFKKQLRSQTSQTWPSGKTNKVFCRRQWKKPTKKPNIRDM